MDSLKLEIRGEEPRSFCGTTNYRELTDEQREQFIDKRITVIEESDMTEAAKQAAMLGGAMNSDLSTAAAFKRYVERDDYWFR